MTTTTILIAKSEFKHFKKAWRHLKITEIPISNRITHVDRHYMPSYCMISIEMNIPHHLFILGKMVEILKTTERIKQTTETSF